MDVCEEWWVLCVAISLALQECLPSSSNETVLISALWFCFISVACQLKFCLSVFGGRNLKLEHFDVEFRRGRGFRRRARRCRCSKLVCSERLGRWRRLAQSCIGVFRNGGEICSFVGLGHWSNFSRSAVAIDCFEEYTDLDVVCGQREECRSAKKTKNSHCARVWHGGAWVCRHW